MIEWCCGILLIVDCTGQYSIQDPTILVNIYFVVRINAFCNINTGICTRSFVVVYRLVNILPSQHEIAIHLLLLRPLIVIVVIVILFTSVHTSNKRTQGKDK